jgi:hypothetical protein
LDMSLVTPLMRLRTARWLRKAWISGFPISLGGVCCGRKGSV